MSSKPIFLKVVLLGDGGVGKSSLMQRFVSDKFDSAPFHTIGVEFLNKDIEVDHEKYTLQIWDTAGQERFKSLRTPFYRGSDCCLLTYAVDDEQSFHNLAIWKKEFLYYADIADTDSFPFVVLGNKIDVERQVDVNAVKKWCDDNGNMPHYETSAKDAINVDLAFIAAIKRVTALNKRGDNKISRTNDETVNLYTVDQAKASSSCSC